MLDERIIRDRTIVRRVAVEMAHVVDQSQERR